jgi:putative ABC transport system permease protein
VTSLLRRPVASLRDPGLRLLFLAVLVAVAALTSVAFFADRVERALERQGASLLAADLVVEHGEAFPSDWLDEARRRGLETARSVTFPSVILSGEQPLLVQIKAVEPPYPLRGRLRVDTPAGAGGNGAAAGRRLGGGPAARPPGPRRR